MALKSSPMKVAIIGNQGSSLLNFRGPLISDLVGRGHSVVVLAPNIELPVADALRALGAEPLEIALSRTGTNAIADLSFILRLRTTLKELSPDVVLGYAAKPAIYGTLAAWLAGVRSRFAMIEGLGYVFISRPHEKLPKRILRRVVVSLFRHALRRADKVFFLNPDDIADFTALGLIAPGQAVNLGGIGVDLEHWPAVPTVSDPITFIFVGRLLRDKGIREYIDAAKAIKARNPATRFLLVGSIDDNPESVEQADVDAWVAQGLVEWPGHVPVAPWLEQSSIFVLPSYREGVPRSTQEAMAMARPVITTDAPGCRETVVDGRNGFLVPVRDAEALAKAMLKFIDNPGTIAPMGAESRRLAEQRFDAHKINAVMMDAMGL